MNSKCVWCDRTRDEHRANLLCPVEGVTSQYYTPPHKWRVSLCQPGFDAKDEFFSSESDAIEAAERLHSDVSPFGFEPVGIYDGRNNIVWLWFQGEQFKKV